jgi:heterodisulfide reductase subunit B
MDLGMNAPETDLQVKPPLEYSYYPGCSLHSTAREFNESTQAVFQALGVELTELADWNCCSAASATTLDYPLSLALPGRNLAIAQAAGRDVVIPCTACYNRHKGAELELQRHAGRAQQIEAAVGFEYRGGFEVRSLLDVLANEVGLDALRRRVRKPLAGLKVVGYYGCLLLRPAEVTRFENPENPVLLGRLLEALGADVKPWSYATDCCGGDQTLVRPEIAQRLVGKLVDHAREAGVQAIVTVCPLCQVSLEMRQPSAVTPMPLFYFTELIGLAFALPESHAWWKKHLISPTSLLSSLSL